MLNKYKTRVSLIVITDNEENVSVMFIYLF